jgi:hypothetical protein
MEKRDRSAIGNSLEDRPTMRLAELERVLEQGEGTPVELWMNGRGRVFVRAYNEGGQSWTDVDVLELVAALKIGGFAGE